MRRIEKARKEAREAKIHGSPVAHRTGLHMRRKSDGLPRAPQPQLFYSVCSQWPAIVARARARRRLPLPALAQTSNFGNHPGIRPGVRMGRSKQGGDPRISTQNRSRDLAGRRSPCPAPEGRPMALIGLQAVSRLRSGRRPRDGAHCHGSLGGRSVGRELS